MYNFLLICGIFRSGFSLLLRRAPQSLHSFPVHGSGSGISSNAKPQLQPGTKADARRKQFGELSKTIDRIHRARSLPAMPARYDRNTASQQLNSSYVQNGSSSVAETSRVPVDDAAAWRNSLLLFEAQIKQSFKQNQTTLIPTVSSNIADITFEDSKKSDITSVDSKKSDDVKIATKVKPESKDTSNLIDKKADKRKNKSKPYVEHQELGTSHFSRITNVKQSLGCLSPYELLILSQASSLPRKMRDSFQEVLNRRLSVSSSSSSLSHPPSVVTVDVDLLNTSSLPSQQHTLKAEALQLDSDASLNSANLVESNDILNEFDFIPEDDADLNNLNEVENITGKQRKSSTKKLDNKKKEIEIFDVNDLTDLNKTKEVFDRVAVVLKDSKQTTFQNALDADHLIRDSSYINNVASFVELCVETGMLKEAQSILTLGYLRSRQRHKRRLRGARPVQNLTIYKKLMHAWATRGNIEAIRKLLLHLSDYNIKLDVHSYAIILMCLARNHGDDISPSAVGEFLDKYRKDNYKLEDILLKSRLEHEDQQLVVKAIRRIYPDFVPNVQSDDYSYNCRLLNHLNTSQVSTNPMHGIITSEEMIERASQQLNLEMQDQIIIDSILPQPQLSTEVINARNNLVSMKEKWRMALKQGFITNKRHLVAYSDADTGSTLLPYLELWGSDVYTDFMLQEVEVLGQDMSAYSPTCSVLHQMLGNKIQNKFLVQSRVNSKYTAKSIFAFNQQAWPRLLIKCKNALKLNKCKNLSKNSLNVVIASRQNPDSRIERVMEMYKRYTKEFDAKNLRRNHREIWSELMNDMELQNFMHSQTERWPSSITKALGKFLYDIIMSEVKVTVASRQKSIEDENRDGKKSAPSHTEIPAFFTVTRIRNNTPAEEVVPHPFLVRLYDDANDTQLRFSPLDMPSIVPPIPWHTHDCGGNMLSTTSIVRNPWLAQKHMEVVKSCPNQQLYPMFDGLNTISACPWRINQPMLDLMIDLFNKGGDSKLDIPENVSLAPELPKATPEMKFEERMKILRENKQIMKERKEEYSLWCTELYRLSIANKYRNEIIWFPHNMDFRGRAYPTPPHFNHMGSDVGRSLLIFAHGKPLGEHGLDWLKIHLINLTGLKKRSSNEERLRFANEIMEEILDSADNPFEGRKWWQGSDDPWQTLACCKELAAAVRSPDPKQFISHVPIHQDGSCNGLQHYAALGRDESGAKSVNLNPFDKPKDVYSDVVDLVEMRRKSDVGEGVNIAKTLDGYVRRKVIKQTIMTTVYGVTQYGARCQIGGQLRHIPEFPNSDVFPGMCYLTEKTFQSLQEMFCSTKEIQDWLVLCAEVISRIRQRPVEWVTPLGWPVLQPYFKTGRVTDKKMGTVTIEKPNTMKQKNAFPPNFIHSLDSAHMMLTAIHCLRAGIVFASVHDCFWTHACDVSTMNKICRERFVALHKEQILEELADYLGDHFGYNTKSSKVKEESADKQSAKELVNHILRRVPKRGTFDINKVLESTYFFS